MSNHVGSSEIRGKRFLKVFGNTYEHRDKIRALGGAGTTWSAAEKCWVISLVGIAHNQAAKIAQQTYELSKLGLKFEVEA